MSVLATVREAVEIAFSAAGDLVEATTWRKTVFGDYDPATGERATVNTDLTVRAVEETIKQGDFGRLGLSVKAVKLIIPAVDFTGGDPVHDDKLIHRGTLYTAKDCAFAGTKAVWEIHADV